MVTKKPVEEIQGMSVPKRRKNTKFFKELTLDFDDVNQDILMVCAFRYALGRQTYVVGSICDILKANWENMPTSRREFFKNEIREAVNKGWAGSELIDVPQWNSILALPD